MLMPFGKYKDRKIEEVPAAVLLTYYQRRMFNRYPEINRYVKFNYSKLCQERDELLDQQDFFRDDPSR